MQRPPKIIGWDIWSIDLETKITEELLKALIFGQIRHTTEPPIADIIAALEESERVLH